LFSADAWKAKIQRSTRNLQAIPQGKQYAGSLIRRICEFWIPQKRDRWITAQFGI
jgi:hypothetical protein